MAHIDLPGGFGAMKPNGPPGSHHIFITAGRRPPGDDWSIGLSTPVD